MKLKIKLKKNILRGIRNKLRGERMEMKILRMLKRFVLEACRSAGSHGMFDIWALQGNKLRLIIAKTNGYLDRKERRDLLRFLEVKPSWAQVEVWWYKSPKKTTKRIIRDEDDVQAQY